MSFNQSRSDKNDTLHRKSGRSASFNQQRTSSGAHGKAGGGAGPAPSPSSSFSSKPSFKKSNNAQGGQSRVNIPPVHSSDSSCVSASQNLQNGAHVQPPLQVAINGPKPSEPPVTQRSTRAVPKAPTSQPATLNSDTASLTTPSKGPGDASKAFPFQFGSINLGLMNGMQIPARTSSAPPNLDEQKRDQARRDTFRAVPQLPIPTPKQHLSSKEGGAVDQPNSVEVHPNPKAKKDIQVSPAPPVSQQQKPSVIPLPMTSMQMPYHPQVSVQFGGPNPQMQSQGVSATSLQMPISMQIAMGNAPQVQQPVFVQGLQPHPMQPQGMMHQGQSMGFTPPMGSHLSPQLGNLGIGITSQYAQQQGGKFGGPRKTTVKITDPKTHEELRLDKRTDAYADGGSSVLRSHPNMPAQSKPIPSFAASHPMSYYPNSYNANNLFYQAPSSLPLTTGQMAPNCQPPRFSYPVNQAPQNISFMNPSALNSLPVNKSGTGVHGVAEQVNLEHARDVHSVGSSVSSGMVQVTVKPAASPSGDRVVDSSLSNSTSIVEKTGGSPSGEVNLSHLQKVLEKCPENSLHSTKPGSEISVSKALPAVTKQSDNFVHDSLSSALPAQSEVSVPVVANAEGRRKETLSRSNSIKDHQKKPVKKGFQPENQIGGQSTSLSGLPPNISEHGVSSSCRVFENSETSNLATSMAVHHEHLADYSEPAAAVIGASTSEASDAKVTGFSSVSSEIPGAGVDADTADAVHHAKLYDSCPKEHLRHEVLGIGEKGEKGLFGNIQQDDSVVDICTAHVTSKSVDLVKQAEEESTLKAKAFGNEAPALTLSEGLGDEPVICHIEIDRTLGNMDVSTSKNLETTVFRKSNVDSTITLDRNSSKSDIVSNKEVSDAKSGLSDHHFAPASIPDPSDTTSQHEGDGLEHIGGSSVSLTTTGSKDRPVELTRTKSTIGRSKKKKKEILQKADALGTTADLYMAYKGPEEKKETLVSPDAAVMSSGSNLKQTSSNAHQVESKASENGVQNKVEPDDWEDAADISTPKLEASAIREQAHGELVQPHKNGDAITAKKYSRDFLLKFSEHCTDLPEGFEITSDIAEALMSVSVSHLVDRDLLSSPGRVIDRPSSAARIDRRGGVMLDGDRWSKLHSPFGSGRDLHADIGFAGTVGFRPGQGSIYGALRNPRAQTPVQYAGGILSGPQSMIAQGGIQRINPDADRWQRATNFQQKGLIPSPQTPLQIMHKADKKYEVGKVADEEEAKQRQLKAILNKLTPQNFEKLFEQVKAVNIDNAVTLTGVISQIFDKALMEPTFCEMYANFCYHLAGELPDFTEDNEKITFKRLLLNKCQEEFERGEREQEEANKADEEGEIKQSKEEREEKRLKARRQMLGNIRLIGELYKKKMLTERIMHECIKKLLGQYQNPDEEDVEALCKLMSTIGEMIDHPKAKEHMDAYFDRMAKLSNNMKLSSRVRFMLKDAIDLRKNKWQQRRKVEGPKKIEEVHRDAAQERQHQATRLARNPSINPSPRRAPMDFGPRGSTILSSQNAQQGSFRGLPAQVHGFGNQDVRFEDSQSYEARTLSVPLPQRPFGDDSITLGPQGGLARGMSIRGPPAVVSSHVAEHTSGDSRRMTTGLNGYSTVSERLTYSPRENLISRPVPDRFAVQATYDQWSAQERNMNYANRDLRNVDRGFDRPLASSPLAQAPGPAFTQNIPSEMAWPEERLRDMSMAAIKEYYSARDEKEVALCIKDLNSPSFHPAMVSLWVIDSFERKDLERDLLAKLLVNLARSRDGILTSPQLIKGFESVLTTLEDAVNDAPKAAEFLGNIFAKVVTENVVTLREIGNLLCDGGEEPGSLLEIGLAGDVLGSTLEILKVEKGESVLKDILIGSGLNLEDFWPPDPNRSRILEKFI